MAIRRFSGFMTAGGRFFWKTLVEHDGWRIQQNNLLRKVSLKPFRLLDPDGVLWASSDTLEELQRELPALIAHFSTKKAFINSEDVKQALHALMTLVASIAGSRAGGRK